MKAKGMDYFVALYDVARVINASLEPTNVLQEIVNCVVKTMPVKRAVSLHRFQGGRPFIHRGY